MNKKINKISINNLRIVSLFILFAVLISLGFSDRADAVDCDSLTALTVTADQRTYAEGDTVTGDIFFTNNTGAAVSVAATGNIYDDTMALILTKSVSGTLPEGVSEYDLSDVFGTLDVDSSVAAGDYTIEVSVSISEMLCTLVDSTIVTIVDHTVPGDFATIQQAIDAASEGEIIGVSAGTYTENITISKDITIKSASRASDTVIDGNGSGSVVIFNSGVTPNAVLDGFTIQNGLSVYGSGIYCESSSPTIKDCKITDNYTTYGLCYGGGIYMNNSSPTITNCNITVNYADYYGGGIYCTNSSATITSCTITGNYSDSKGGGIYMDNSSATITDCMINNNGSTSGGGGIYCANSSSLTITSSTITKNAVPSKYNPCGGIYCTYSSATITDCTISENHHGGICIGNYTSSVNITNCTITGNSYLVGGGILIGNHSSPTITNCTISNNTVDSFTIGAGGGISIGMYSSPTIINCTITDNTSSDYGGGIAINIYSEPIIMNCTISNNFADYGGGIYMNGSSAAITNTILWNNTASVAGDEVYVSTGTPVVTYCDITGGYSGIGNIDSDPFFVDDTNSDITLRNYHLKAWSPCIDAGTAAGAPSDDIDVDVRPTLGTIVDIGSDETSGIDNDGDCVFSDADCNDDDPNIYPGAAEICNGMDDNCDGQVDEGC